LSNTYGSVVVDYGLVQENSVYKFKPHIAGSLLNIGTGITTVAQQVNNSKDILLTLTTSDWSDGTITVKVYNTIAFNETTVDFLILSKTYNFIGLQMNELISIVDLMESVKVVITKEATSSPKISVNMRVLYKPRLDYGKIYLYDGEYEWTSIEPKYFKNMEGREQEIYTYVLITGGSTGYEFLIEYPNEYVYDRFGDSGFSVGDSFTYVNYLNSSLLQKIDCSIPIDVHMIIRSALLWREE